MTLRLALIIDGDASGAKEAAQQASESARGFTRIIGQDMRGQSARTTREVQGGFGGMRSSIGAANGALIRTRTLVSAIATGALTLFIRRNAQAGDEIANTAKQLGISAGKLQEYSIGAELAGVSQEELTGALRFFSKSLGDNDGQVTEFHKALGQLGLRIGDIKGLNFDRALELVSDRLAGVRNESERNSIAFELFSRTGIRAINFLAAGSGELNRFAAEARKLGLVISDETVKKAQEADDEFDKMAAAAKVAGVNIAAGFLPALKSIRELVTDPAFQQGLKNISGGLADLVKLLVDNKDKVIVAASAFMGLRAGAAAGRIFGGRGALLGGILGLGAGAAAGATLAIAELEQLEADLDDLIRRRDSIARKIETTKVPQEIGSLATQYEVIKKEISEKRAAIEAEKKKLDATLSEPLKVTVNKSGQAPVVFPEIDQAIRELRLNRMVLDREFKGFSDGFPALLQSLNLPGVDPFSVLSAGAGKLTGQLRELNVAVAAFEGAQLRSEVETPLEKYNREIEKANTLLALGGVSQETFNRKVLQLSFPQLTDLVGQLSNTSGLIDQQLVGSLNTATGALADWADGTKKGSDAWKDFERQVLRGLQEMLIQMTIVLPIARALQAALGGLGLGVSAAEPLSITPPAQAPALGPAGFGGGPNILGAVHHVGYGPGDPIARRRYVHPAYFENAPRFHGGIGPGERAAVIRDDEGVFTPGQMRALGLMSSGGAQPPVININLKTSGQADVKASQPRRNGNGGFDIDVLVEVVGQGMAQRQSDGQGAFHDVLAREFGVTRKFG